MKNPDNIDHDQGSADRVLIYAVAEWGAIMSREPEDYEAAEVALCLLEALEELIVETEPTSITGRNAKSVWLMQPCNFSRYGETTERFDELQPNIEEFGSVTPQ